MIQKFFDETAFWDKPDKICQYVHWALKPNGPAYYESPTPQECKANCTHMDYIVGFALLPNKYSVWHDISHPMAFSYPDL